MKEWTFMDRSEWGPGPWDAEKADRVQWQDDDTGLDCLARRNSLGAWCGYVAVPKSHSLFGKHFDDVGGDLRVHGGVNFSKPCDGDAEHGICHASEGGDEAFWFGFDCSHAWDVIPGLQTPIEDAEYRTLDYVREQCSDLAAQLKAVA